MREALKAFLFGGYMELTKEIIKRYFYYNKDTGDLIRKIGISQTKAGDKAGHLKKSDGYVYIRFLGKVTTAHRIIWIMHNGENPNCDIDHINCIRHDNRIENLRLANRSMNLHNSSARSRNTSGHKGIGYVKNGKRKWKAMVMIDYKQHYIGVFNTIEEAINARNKYCLEKLGENYKNN